jgi:ABC-type branched-subunit amino acid transport system substrate-binding protein
MFIEAQSSFGASLAERRGCIRRLAATFIVLLAAGISVPGAQPSPFVNLRNRLLEYVGPANDLTNSGELRIGWFGPSETTNRQAGAMWWAASFAVREANAAGGYDGKVFRLVPRWSADPWGSGVALLTRMAFEDEPLAILGSIDSASTHLAEQVVAKANLPLVSPVTTDTSLTLAGVAWMFSCAPSDAVIARALVGDVFAIVGTNRVALVACTDHDSRMASRELLKEFSTAGRLPDVKLELAPNAPSIDAQLLAIASANPAALVIAAPAQESARLVRQARRLLPEAVMFGTAAMGRSLFRELAGAEADGVRFPVLDAGVAGSYNLKPEAQQARRLFMQSFAVDTGADPDYTAVLTYDATRLLLQAIREAGPNRARIRDALAKRLRWEGLAGEVTFDGTGQNTRAPVTMATIHAGRILPLRADSPLAQERAEVDDESYD